MTEGMDAIVGAAIMSITLNPMLFRVLAAWELRGARRSRTPAPTVVAPNSAIDTHANVVIVGADDVVRRLGRLCAEAGRDVARSTRVHALQVAATEGVATVFGDPVRRDVLEAAGVGTVRVPVVAARARRRIHEPRGAPGQSAHRDRRDRVQRRRAGLAARVRGRRAVDAADERRTR